MLIRGLAGRADGQVLVVAAAALDSDLARALTRDLGYDLGGRVVRAEADPSMGYADRVELAAGLLPRLPAAGVERIARQTATFKDVFTVAGAGRLAELGPETEPADAVAVVDAVAGGVLERARPSSEAVIAAWAGGALHDRQARAALEVLGAIRQEDDPRVVRAGWLVRLVSPADGRMAQLEAALPVAARQQMAAVVLGEAAVLAADASVTLVDRVVARQAAHHVRGDLADRSELPGVQVGLIRGLEKLGDRAAAYDVATTALAGLEALPPAARDAVQRQELLMAVLRLARTRPGRGQDEDPATAEAVELALSGGAVVRPEARVWAAVDLLNRPGRRKEGLRLAHQVTGELEARHIHGELASHWRLLLAFHSGQAGDGALAQRLLAPLVSAGPAGQQDAAAAVLRAIGGPQVGTRLQIILLEGELTRTPAAADDDLLRLHHALAVDYGLLGDYREALHHGRQELPLRRRIQGDDHLETLRTRHEIASWTGQSGDPAEALRLTQDLLPDVVRVLGPDHFGTLATRHNIAGTTGRSGDPAGALRLARDLLPDQIRVLGPDHPNTLATRNNIAAWTSANGDPAGALRLLQDLLPDQVRVLGPDHPDTLATRNDIALGTGESGDPAGALRLAQDLLPDQIRVLGPDHPNTLRTRNSIAATTSESGDPAGALRLLQDLLPDHIRVLGPDHPSTLAIRHNIAATAGNGGDPAGALRLAQDLLPDQVRVLGPDHPDTLTTRNEIAYWTESLSANTQDSKGTPEAHNTTDPDGHPTQEIP
jgi:hypothetical protein